MSPDNVEGLSLQEAMIGAAEAPPAVRIEFRDPIARNGADAVAAIESWLREPVLAAFAVRTIARAADFGGEREAIRALRTGLRSPISPQIERDLIAALVSLGSSPISTGPKPGGAGTRKEISDPEKVLVPGETYRRTDLHGRFGGNQQTGISYPTSGNFAMLFSDPNAAHEHGYRDRWDSGTYRYYGAWSGEGDMALTTHNRTVIARSPNLHLFQKTGDLWRYIGRFECLGPEPELTVKDGRECKAIVFVLRSIGAS